ncbi:Pentatricopeptide repeat-containing protein [Carex littledalei]|uniref:Pentatricopeptide repeat-containing protein n=1 Tax=Carex littledalei TaxID=544730 RepID=A0A833RN61_9POAL|nr:Pentatricopeptide repeat-containing protein [Carex littledalei]
MAPPFLLRRVRTLLTGLNLNPRPFSTSAPLSSKNNFDPVASSDEADDNLRTRLLRLRFPKRSATAAIQKWVLEGRDAPAGELREAVRELSRCGQYKHALEVSEWMKLHHEPDLSGNDYSTRIDLITKVFGLNAAEEFFNGLASKPAEAYTALLHNFASSKSIDKAEKLFDQMKSENVISDALPFNEIMTLYVSVGEAEKVFRVVSEMKSLKVGLDLYSYNLWVSAYGAILDFEGVKRVLSEMEQDPNLDQRSNIYRNLVRVYVDVGRFEGVDTGTKLIEADTKVTVREWITYDLLVILHASLGNKGRIKEMWRCMKMSSGKMTYRNYICVISSYLAVGEVQEVGEVIDQWKESKEPEFDLSACARLFDAFLKVDLIEIAANFRKLMQEKNYEISTSA